jgi:hypothetical protein
LQLLAMNVLTKPRRAGERRGECMLASQMQVSSSGAINGLNRC